MTNTIKKNQSTTQAVISVDNNFILAKNIGNFTDVISPFKKQNNIFRSGFVLPINQIHRVHTLYDTIEGISQYTVLGDEIIFDCVHGLPSDCFGNIEEGYIHFSSVRRGEKQKDKEKEVYIVDPRLVFRVIEPELITTQFEQKIKFKSEFLKAFPAILKPGFMFSTVNKSECQLFITVMNPSKGFIGECSKFEIVNVIQYLLPLWSIFEINIGKDINIYFREEFIKNLFKNNSNAILLYISYNLNQPSEITLGKFGEAIDIK